jgi:hypothetical protein
MGLLSKVTFLMLIVLNGINLLTDHAVTDCSDVSIQGVTGGKWQFLSLSVAMF